MGSPLFGLAGYVSFAEQGMPVFKNLTFKQGIQLYDLESVQQDVLLERKP